jgi:uncharacterized RDD family membrane protein YckC
MSEIATQSIGVSSQAASEPAGLAYGGFWRRIAAATFDLCLVWLGCSLLWAILSLGLGDPTRLSGLFGIGVADRCGSWHEVMHTFESDALEPTERLCVTTIFGLWPSSWMEHQEAHRDDLTHNYADYGIYTWQSDAFGHPIVVVSNWTATCVALAVYFAWMLRRTGQTFGQRLLRVAVRSTTPFKIGAFRAILRSVIKSSPLLVAVSANFAWAMYDQGIIASNIPARMDLLTMALLALLPLTMVGAHRRGLHDRVAGTEVVRVDR